MSSLSEAKELQDRFKTIWNSRIPVEWPNVTFAPPSPQAPWCRFVITNSQNNGDNKQLTFGSTTNWFRYPGVLYIQLFAPLNSGEAVIKQYADDAAVIFNNWCGTNIRCRAATVKTIGKDGNGWYQVNVSIPFTRDELK